MAVTIRAHFDGRVIVPDEPVELPVDQPFELEVHLPPSEATAAPHPVPPARQERYPLRGTPIRYDRPTDPVAEEGRAAAERGPGNARD